MPGPCRRRKAGLWTARTEAGTVGCMRAPPHVAQRLFLSLFVALALLTPLASAEEDEDLEARRQRLKEAQTEFDKSQEAFVQRVNAAIDKGVKWLVSKQRSDGYWHFHPGPNKADMTFPGKTALVLLTLAKCDLKLKDRDKVLEKGLHALEAYRSWEATSVRFPEGVTGHTYSNSLLVLMYDAIYRYKPKPKKKKRASRYGKSKRKKKNPCRYPKNVAKKIIKLIQWIEEVQEEHIWRYPGPAGQNQDLSNTQYALLALQAAARCGLRVSPEVYKKALVYVLANQQKNGPEVKLYGANPAWQPGVDRYGPVIPIGTARARGWGYMPGTQRTGSMTTAGIAALAIISERLRKLEQLTKADAAKIREALRDGVGWFSKHFTVAKNPGNPGWHYYYLYGLERAGDLLGVRYLGEHDWYREGADHLIAAQQDGGSWSGGEGAGGVHPEDETLRTCFALLFLKRATAPPEVPLGPVVTGG